MRNFIVNSSLNLNKVKKLSYFLNIRIKKIVKFRPFKATTRYCFRSNKIKILIYISLLYLLIINISLELVNVFLGDCLKYLQYLQRSSHNL